MLYGAFSQRVPCCHDNHRLLMMYCLLDIFCVVDGNSKLSDTQIDILGQNCNKIENIVSKVAAEHKELHGALSKIGKSIDKVPVLYNIFLGYKL